MTDRVHPLIASYSKGLKAENLVKSKSTAAEISRVLSKPHGHLNYVILPFTNGTTVLSIFHWVSHLA